MLAFSNGTQTDNSRTDHRCVTPGVIHEGNHQTLRDARK
jgi:hypothetical protein